MRYIILFLIIRLAPIVTHGKFAAISLNFLRRFKNTNFFSVTYSHLAPIFRWKTLRWWIYKQTADGRRERQLNLFRLRRREPADSGRISRRHQTGRHLPQLSIVTSAFWSLQVDPVKCKVVLRLGSIYKDNVENNFSCLLQF